MLQRLVISFLVLLACSPAWAQTANVVDTENGAPHSDTVDMGQFALFGPDACMGSHHHGANIDLITGFRFVIAQNGDRITDPEFLVGDPCGFGLLTFTSPLPNIGVDFDPLLIGILSLGGNGGIEDPLTQHELRALHEARRDEKFAQLTGKKKAAGDPQNPDGEEGSGGEEHLDEFEESPTTPPAGASLQDLGEEWREEDEKQLAAEASFEVRLLSLHNSTPLADAVAFLLSDDSGTKEDRRDYYAAVFVLVERKLVEDTASAIQSGETRNDPPEVIDPAAIDEAVARAIEFLRSALGPDLASNTDARDSLSTRIAINLQSLVQVRGGEPARASLVLQALRQAIGFKGL